MRKRKSSSPTAFNALYQAVLQLLRWIGMVRQNSKNAMEARHDAVFGKETTPY